MSLRFLVGAAFILLVLNQAGLALFLLSRLSPRLSLVLADLLLLLYPMWRVLRARGIPARDALRLRGASPAATFLGAAGVVAILPALLVFAERWIHHPARLEEVLAKLARADSGPELVMVLFALAIVPSVTEELFFRGFLQRGLEVHLGRWPGLIIATLTFGLLHGLSRAPTSIVLGGLLGWVASRSRSVVPGMVAHAGINAMLVLPASGGVDPEAGAWKPDLPWSVAAGSVLMTLLLFAAFVRATRGSGPTPTTTGDATSPPHPPGDDPPAPE
jgi:membrane protease YdiL (CAAX protease family)